MEQGLASRFKVFRPSKSNPKYPNFDNISDKHIEESSFIVPDDTYHNPIFWQPRFYQVPMLSPEFLKEIQKFKNLRQWK